MGFQNTRLQTNVNFGTRGAPNFSTGIFVNDAGAETRVGRWTAPLREYEADFSDRLQYHIYDLLQFFIAMNGPLHSFRFKDWTDYATTSNGTTHLPDVTGSIPTVSNADVVIGTGDGSETDFTLAKEYVDTPAAITRTRLLQKPVSGTVTVAIDGVAKTEGVDYTVNYTTGVVTFGSAVTNLLDVTAGCEFDVEVRFGDDTNFDITKNGYATASTRLTLVEQRDQTPNPELMFHGGSTEHGNITGTTSITLSQGRVHSFDPLGTGRIFKLPNVGQVEDGGPLFYLVNDGAFDVELQDSTGTKLLDIPANQIVVAIMTDDGFGGRTWIVSRS